MPWGAVGCHGVSWGAMGCRGVPWGAMGCRGVFTSTGIFGLSSNPSAMSLILIPHSFNQVCHRVPFKFLNCNFYVMARTKRKKKEAMAERRSKEEWVLCLISFFKA